MCTCCVNWSDEPKTKIALRVNVRKEYMIGNIYTENSDTVLIDMNMFMKRTFVFINTHTNRYNHIISFDTAGNKILTQSLRPFFE